MNILYRDHRGGLGASLETVRPVNSLNDIWQGFSDLEKDAFKVSDLKIKFYCDDKRINWKTYIITVDGYGVLGFTNGEVK